MKPFTLCYAKCETFCWFSRRPDKRSFSLKTKFSAICPKDADFFLLSLLLRGAFIGFIISGIFYIAAVFKDTPGFFAGIVYGIIIDYVATRFEET